MPIESKTAVVLAGGLGTRLRPYTVVLPKPLMPLGDSPILGVIVRQLAKAGFDEIVMAVNHQAEIIRAFFGCGEKWNIRIRYSLETTPLGTMGPLRLISGLPEHFLLMNGDILTDLDFAALLERHAAEDRLFTLTSAMRSVPFDYGVLEFDDSGGLLNYLEKPVLKSAVSMGIYAVSRRLIGMIPADEHYGVDQMAQDLLRLGRPVNVHRHEGYWLDIGRPDDYELAIEDYEQQRSRFLFE